MIEETDKEYLKLLIRDEIDTKLQLITSLPMVKLSYSAFIMGFREYSILIGMSAIIIFVVGGLYNSLLLDLKNIPVLTKDVKKVEKSLTDFIFIRRDFPGVVAKLDKSLETLDSLSVKDMALRNRVNSVRTDLQYIYCTLKQSGVATTLHLKYNC